MAKNMNLFHITNKKIIEDFTQHVKAFKSTREDDPKIRIKLFPDGLLSIFGIKKVCDEVVHNVSALQNWVNSLICKDSFISLAIIPQPVLTYWENDEIRMTYLTDAPRVRQIYFSRRLYYPISTNVGIKGMQFFFRWLTDNNVRHEISDYKDLTKITIFSKDDKEYQVRLYYEYCLSEADLQSHPIRNGWIAVNTHIWNGAPVSEDAFNYAQKVGIILFNQTEFFEFCHREII